MNDRPEISDDSIKTLLERRAARAKGDGLLAAVRKEAAVTPQRRFRRLGFGLIRGPVAVGLAGAASVVILVVALGIASGGHLPGIAAASPGPSFGSHQPAQASTLPPATPVVPPVAGPVLPLTVGQLNVLMGSNPRLLSGRQLVITGTVARCVQRGGTCPLVVLVGSNPQLGVADASNRRAGPWTSPAVQLTGPFAATLANGTTLEYQGPVVTTADGGAYLPSQLSRPADVVQGDQYLLVWGWVAGRLDPVPCPATKAGLSPGPEYGCGHEATLSDTRFQPVTANSFVLPGDGFVVQNDAYQDFAPAPGVEPVIGQSTAHLALPEQATFLLHVVPVGAACSPLSTCPVARWWAIQSRVDPWEFPAGVPTPAPTVESPPPSPDPAIALRPLTVDQLNLFMRMNSQSPSGRQLVISGTIVANMAASICAAPCTGWVLQGSDPTLYVQPVGDVGPGPWNQGGAPLTGAFAATMTDGFVLDYQGPVSTTVAGTAWLPSQLPLPSAPNAGVGYWLVHGWIGGPSIIPQCVAVPSPQPSYQGPQYTCAEMVMLSTNLPGEAGGSVRVQNDAYEVFAPSPTRVDPGTQPEQATFLVHAIQAPPCGPNADCFIPDGNYHWAIVARIDPWPVPALP